MADQAAAFVVPGRRHIAQDHKVEEDTAGGAAETPARKLLPNWDKQVTDFDYCERFGSPLLRGLRRAGVSGASVHRVCWPISEHRDCYAVGDKLTGLTTGAVIGVLATLDLKLRECQAIIIAPDAERADEIHTLATGDVTTYLPVAVHRGSVWDPARTVTTAEVLVSPLARTVELAMAKQLPLETVRLICIDDVQDIVATGQGGHLLNLLRDKRVRNDLQVVALSHRDSPAEQRLVQQLFAKAINDPAVFLTKTACLLRARNDWYVDVEQEMYKLDTLVDVLELVDIGRNTTVVVYANSKRKVRWITEELRSRGVESVLIDEDLPRLERDAAALRCTSSCERTVVVATDCLWQQRVPIVRRRSMSQLVLNYDPPRAATDYVDRLRCGSLRGSGSLRGGTRRMAITFITDADRRCVTDIEQANDIHLEEAPMTLADLL